jgi:hypothetical protein
MSGQGCDRYAPRAPLWAKQASNEYSRSPPDLQNAKAAAVRDTELLGVNKRVQQRPEFHRLLPCRSSFRQPRAAAAGGAANDRAGCAGGASGHSHFNYADGEVQVNWTFHDRTWEEFASAKGFHDSIRRYFPRQSNRTCADGEKFDLTSRSRDTSPD